jgi:hypothetical protein
MRRREMIALGLAGILLAGAAQARTLEERLVAQLADQGFRIVEVTRTLLGRTRIVAVSDRGRREIVFNPRTGEILRDLWMPLVAGGDTAPGLVDPRDDGDDDGGRGRGRGRGRGGDGDDGDAGDDRDDRDGGSGSGGGRD